MEEHEGALGRLSEALMEALRERDKARAEVKQLREDLDRHHEQEKIRLQSGTNDERAAANLAIEVERLRAATKAGVLRRLLSLVQDVEMSEAEAREELESDGVAVDDAVARMLKSVAERLARAKGGE